MSIPDPLRRRISPFVLLAALGAQAAAVTPTYGAESPPLSCDDPVVLRMLGAGLHFRGSVPEGYQAAEGGLHNPQTGEELPITIEARREETVLRVEDTRVGMRNIRRTGETADGWRCAADFTLERENRTTRGEADYTVRLSGLNFQVRGTFTIEGVEIRF